MEWKLVIFGLMLCSWMSLLWRVTIAGFYSEAHLHIYCSSRLDTWQSYLSIFTSSAYGIYCRKISCLSTPVVFISIQVALILLVLVFTYNNPNPGLLLAEIVQILFLCCCIFRRWEGLVLCAMKYSLHVLVSCFYPGFHFTSMHSDITHMSITLNSHLRINILRQRLGCIGHGSSSCTQLQQLCPPRPSSSQ